MPLKEQNNFILACDVGATNFRLCIFDGAEIIEETKLKTPSNNFLSLLKGEMTKFLAGRSVSAIALSVAGAVNQTEKSVTFTNIGGHPRVYEKDFLDIAPTSIMLNDALAAVYAEYFNTPKRNLVYITISTGIGTGIISQGKPVHLTKNGIREFGPRVVKSEFNFECGCGEKNHWEAFCSGKNLVRFYIEWAKEHGYTPRELKEAKEVFLTAKEGDELAKRFLNEGFGEINRQGIKKIIDEFAPEKIVFGGSVAYNNQEEIRSELVGKVEKLPEISFTEFGDDISLVGVAQFANSQKTIKE